MHAISSYRGITDPRTYTPTHTHTNRQDRLQYTAPQLARGVITIQTELVGALKYYTQRMTPPHTHSLDNSLA